MSKASSRARELMEAAVVTLQSSPSTPGLREWTIAAEHEVLREGGLLAQLAAEVERLEKERTAPGYKTLHLTETYTADEAGRHAVALTADNARLREALRRYGQHRNGCAGFPATSEEYVTTHCDCGLGAALSGGKERA